MKVRNPSSYDDVKILKNEKYYFGNDEEIENIGYNYRAYEFELTDYDMIKLFVSRKKVMLNVDGEYAIVLKYKEEK